MSTSGDATELAPPIVVARDEAEPLYVQIAGQIRQRIHSGLWPAHYRLPSETALQGSLRVSRSVLRQALQALQEEGLITRFQGRGTFVTPTVRPDQRRESSLTSLAEILRISSVSFDTRLLSRNVLRSDDSLDFRLPGDKFLSIRRVRTIPEGPIAVLNDDISLNDCAGLEKTDLTGEVSLFQTLEDEFGIALDHADRTFDAVAASGPIAELLFVPEGTPVLSFEQVAYLHDDTPVTHSSAWVRTDLHKLSITLRRAQ